MGRVILLQTGQYRISDLNKETLDQECMRKKLISGFRSDNTLTPLSPGSPGEPDSPCDKKSE